MSTIIDVEPGWRLRLARQSNNLSRPMHWIVETNHHCPHGSGWRMTEGRRHAWYKTALDALAAVNEHKEALRCGCYSG